MAEPGRDAAPDWTALLAAHPPGPLEGRAVRVVESQAVAATRALVPDLGAQARLEALLERAKPPLPPEAAGLHPLLATPFRYRPLRRGSRFGRPGGRGLWYGSLALEDALAELAYYRLRFLEAMAEPPPRPLETEHTAVWVAYATARGVRLQAPPWDAHRARIADPASWAASQALGDALRAAGVEAAEYPSARSAGVHVVLLTPRAFARPEPLRLVTPILCRAEPAGVEISVPAERRAWTFPRERFLVAGRLPVP